MKHEEESDKLTKNLILKDILFTCVKSFIIVGTKFCVFLKKEEIFVGTWLHGLQIIGGVIYISCILLAV